MGNKDKYAVYEQYSNGKIFERVNIWNGKKFMKEKNWKYLIGGISFKRKYSSRKKICCNEENI